MSSGNPAFKGFLKASGKAEVWEGSSGRGKEDQLGWKTRTNESSYSSDTLIGNWNEERFDVSRLAQPKCLPSQYDHYFETTYRYAYSSSPSKVPEGLKYSRGDETKAFPAHQPILDPPELKQYYNSFMTSSTEAYGVPKDSRQREESNDSSGETGVVGPSGENSKDDSSSGGNQ